jgi:hypothetical protein
MKKLYRVYYKGEHYYYDGVSYIDSNSFNNEVLKKNNFTETDMQTFLKKKSLSFYCYVIWNEEIFKDIKKEFFYKIIMGDFQIDTSGLCLAFTTSDNYYPDTFSLYRDNIFNLEEIKKLHNIFSKYKKDKDYIATEKLFFKYRKSANEIIEKLNNYNPKSNNYCIYEYNVG